MKFIGYKSLNYQAGISHHLSNLMAMAKEAFYTDRVLIPPTFILSGSHNYGKLIKSRLCEYFDFSCVKVNNDLIRISCEAIEYEGAVILPSNHDIMSNVEKIIIKDLHGISLVRKSLENIYSGFAQADVSVTIHPQIQEIAQRNVFESIGSAVWIHVRRGDLLHKTCDATSPKNIARVIRTIAPDAKCIYIATNETRIGYLNELKTDFTVLTCNDIAEFKQLSLQDNYKLFLVEKHFSKFFKCRISTFKTNDTHFQGYLSNIPGWQ